MVPQPGAAYLPGWVFNVAVITHGEEAFLAAVFLFTVHFFNNHFPAREILPLDTVMFTGTMTLEHFVRDHPLHYKRLVESGELQKYLVDAPRSRCSSARRSWARADRLRVAAAGVDRHRVLRRPRLTRDRDSKSNTGAAFKGKRA